MASDIILGTVYKAIDKFSAPLKRMAKASKGFGQKAHLAMAKAERGVRRLLTPLNKLTKRFGGIAAIVGGLTLGAAAAAGASAFVDLDKNISAASAKFGVFDRQSDVFISIRKKAVEMGATTEFTSGQAAAGMKNLATAGFSVEQAMTGINTVLDLATATQSDLTTASDVAAKSLAAFGLRSKDPVVLDKNLKAVTDTLNKLITSSGFANLEEVLTTIGASGASAKAAGLSIQTWAAATGTAVTAGIDASSAGTQLNMALTKLAKPAAEGQALMTKLGIKVQDARGNYRDFFDILADVEKGTKNMGSRQKAAALATIFGARAQKVINVLLDKGAAGMREYRKQIEDAQGVTGKMAGFMRKGLGGAIAAMKSAFEAVAITIGDTFQPEIDALIENLTKIARGSGEWLRKNKALIKFIFKIAKAVIIYFAALKAIMLLIKTWNAITKIATVVQTVFNAVLYANPIGLIILAIMALVAGIVLLIKKWKAMVNWVKTSDSGFAKFIRFILLPLKLMFMAIKWAIQKVVEGFKSMITWFKQTKAFAALVKIGEKLRDVFSAVGNVFKKVWEWIKKIFKMGTEPIRKLLSIFGGKGEGFHEKIKGLYNTENEVANVPAAQTAAQTERYEEISKQQLDISLRNKTDKDVQVESNTAAVPITTTTY